MRPFKKTIYEYKTFQIKGQLTINPDIEGLLFCARALSSNRNDKRKIFNHLYVKGNFIVGTNGARLHEYKLKERIPNGFYAVLVKNKRHVVLCQEKIIDEYPKWKSLFPNKTQLIDTENITIDKVNFDRTMYQLNNISKFPVNISFIKDLEDFMQLHFIESKDWLYFQGQGTNTRAIIMGICE